MRSDDDSLVDMARRMRAKFDKYWGNIDKMNMMLYAVVMLDPRHKFNYLLYVFKNMYGSERGEMMGNLTKSALFDTFEDYKKLYVSTNRTSTSSMSSSSMEMRGIASGDSNDTDSERVFVRSHRKKYQQMISEIGGMDESELDMYLHERIEKDYPKFDVLDWWKVHSPRFPILSRLARDVLAMPISTVASESVFSTGGRIIDDFKASLTPKMAQSLICCQDWLRHNPMKSSEEDYDFIQNIERDFSQSIGTESGIIGI
ncbi:zinc finger BED domain-containing protein RICESLEEPER 2-like isoform X3 [Henckelia pumila]|uniref:zinc finger BED domain-containing protein RICESLEEPER 2-like isoform X3 n=1 Tax=Henckelia pumila TaxID=405737 RepID=UPI003C6DFC48